MNKFLQKYTGFFLFCTDLNGTINQQVHYIKGAPFFATSIFLKLIYRRLNCERVAPLQHTHTHTHRIIWNKHWNRNFRPQPSPGIRVLKILRIKPRLPFQLSKRMLRVWPAKKSCLSKLRMLNTTLRILLNHI